jgi:rSAM/selenodomain-associated transferase 2
MLSIIIPTLNEAAYLPDTLAALARLSWVGEILCCDGGSRDGTPEVAKAFGATVLFAPQGRGSQQRAGAEAATGNVLWFLHADTLAPSGAADQIHHALCDPSVAGGNFRLRFEGNRAAARFLTALYPRLEWLGLRYGDSGFFFRRSIYEAAGGFRPLPIFEDLDLLRRVRRLGRWRTISTPLITSSRRFHAKPFAPVFARWSFLQTLYWAGVDPHRLGRMYYPGSADPKSFEGSSPSHGSG